VLHPAAVLITHRAHVVCYFIDVYPFIYFIVAMYVHHLGLCCILFRGFLISKIGIALQLTKLLLKKVTTTTFRMISDIRHNPDVDVVCVVKIVLFLLFI